LDAIIQTDSSDAFAWLTLGECEMRDRMVVRDSRSMSGWRFRSSYEAAARAYARGAEQLGPQASPAFREWLAGRLSRVLIVVSNKRRSGFAVVRDTITLLAAPFLDGDTVGYVPFELKDVAKATGAPPADRRDAALARNRAWLKAAIESWVSSAPEMAAAVDSLAAITEISDGVANVGGHQRSALEIVQSSSGLKRDSLQRLRHAITETRLLLKAGEFSRAREISDSALATIRWDASAIAGAAGLAAVSGNVRRTVELSRGLRTVWRVATDQAHVLPVPIPVADAGLALGAYAIFPGQADSVRTYLKKTDSLISGFFAANRLPELRAAILSPALANAVVNTVDSVVRAVIRTLPKQADMLRRAQFSLLVGDTADARSAIASIRSRAVGRAPGMNAVDGTLRQSVVELALRDTGAAVSRLDFMLRALSTVPVSLLDQPEQATALVEAMALRAELAQQANDPKTARRWASAVVELWGGAPNLSSFVNRMRRIAQAH
jgi:hypothetical protein